MILFCFALIDEIANRGQRWLERHTTCSLPAKDTTARNAATARLHGCQLNPAKRPIDSFKNRLEWILFHLSPPRLQRFLRDSDKQSKAIWHVRQYANELG